MPADVRGKLAWTKSDPMAPTGHWMVLAWDDAERCWEPTMSLAVCRKLETHVRRVALDAVMELTGYY